MCIRDRVKSKQIYRLEFLSDGRVRVVALSGIGGGVGVGGAAGVSFASGDSKVGLHADFSADANAILVQGDTREFASEAAAIRYFQSELAQQAVQVAYPMLGEVGGLVADRVVAQFVEQGAPYSTYAGIGQDGSATAASQLFVWPDGASASFDAANGVQHYADGTVSYVYFIDASGEAGSLGLDSSAAGGGQYEVRIGPNSAVLHLQAQTEVDGVLRLTETSLDLSGAPQAIIDAVVRGDLGNPHRGPASRVAVQAWRPPGGGDDGGRQPFGGGRSGGGLEDGRAVLHAQHERAPSPDLHDRLVRQGAEAVAADAGVAAVQRGLPVLEYSARRIKQSVVGTGAANKEQVQHMVRTLLKLPAAPQADAADALAAALCHAHTRQSLERLPGAVGTRRGRLR